MVHLEDREEPASVGLARGPAGLRGQGGGPSRARRGRGVRGAAVHEVRGGGPGAVSKVVRGGSLF